MKSSLSENLKSIGGSQPRRDISYTQGISQRTSPKNHYANLNFTLKDAPKAQLQLHSPSPRNQEPLPNRSAFVLKYKQMQQRTEVKYVEQQVSPSNRGTFRAQNYFMPNSSRILSNMTLNNLGSARKEAGNDTMTSLHPVSFRHDSVSIERPKELKVHRRQFSSCNTMSTPKLSVIPNPNHKYNGNNSFAALRSPKRSLPEVIPSQQALAKLLALKPMQQQPEPRKFSKETSKNDQFSSQELDYLSRSHLIKSYYKKFQDLHDNLSDPIEILTAVKLGKLNLERDLDSKISSLRALESQVTLNPNTPKSKTFKSLHRLLRIDEIPE